MNLFLTGFMGSGKTTVGRLLAKKMNYSFVDIDCFIENRYHKTINKIFEEKGEAGFREIEHKVLMEIINYENVVVSSGGGLPCFFDNMDLMNQNGITIYLREDNDDLIKRLNFNKDNRPLIKGKNQKELQDFIETKLREREPFYNRAKLVFDVKSCSTKHEINQWVDELLVQINLILCQNSKL